MSRQKEQFALFEEPEGRALSVSEALGKSRPASKQHAAFERLARQIETERALLAEWQDYPPRYNQRLAEEMEPLRDAIWQAQRRLLTLLDAHYGQRGAVRGKQQRATLRAWITGLAQELLFVRSDPELQALHDRHADVTHKELDELGAAMIQDMAQEAFGQPMADILEGAGSMEETMRRLAEEMLARERQPQTPRPPRRPSAKAEAAAARRDEARKEASQSVREVYRKLASALHPDRAADMPRERQTALMQRVNQAYEAGRLLDLLNIQLEIEQIDADHLAALSAARLKHFVAVLREQLQEIRNEIEVLRMPFRSMLGMPYQDVRVAHVEASLSAAIAGLRQDLAQAEADAVEFQDAAWLCAVLKTRCAARPESGPGFDEMAAMLDGMLDSHMAPAAPRRRRKR